MPTKARLAAIYARVSTEEQTRGLIESTKTQVAKCKEKALARAIPIASDESGLIVEEQHPGGDLRWKGTQFMALVERAERGEFTDLFCLDIDRFCRGGAQAFWEQMGYFQNAGIAVQFVMDDVPEGMPFADTVRTARAEAAQWLKDKAREASVRNRTEWAEQGNIVIGNKPPFGFRFVDDKKGRTTRLKRTLVGGLEPDPVTGPALYHITQHVADGGAVRDAKRWLETHDIPTPRGAPCWSGVSIRKILHNHTNYGGRRSFITQRVERENAVRRPKDQATRHRQMPTAPEDQYVVTEGLVVAPEGLTHALWERALARLLANREVASRHKNSEPEEVRAEHSLLFGGRVRCDVCGHGLTARPSNYRYPARSAYFYTCAHTGTIFAREEVREAPTVNIHCRILDETVWKLAVNAMRDPAFLERLVAATDAAAGPAIRVASLQKQLDEANRTRDKLLAQLERLDADDDLVADYQNKLRQNKAIRDNLKQALAAAEKELAAENERQARLTSFRAYAAEHCDSLDEKTPIERRRILLAMRTKVRVEPGEQLGRVSVRFDIRGLPGAAEALYRPSPDDIDVSPPNLTGTWDDIPALDIIEDDLYASLVDELDNDKHDGAIVGAATTTEGAVSDGVKRSRG